MVSLWVVVLFSLLGGVLSLIGGFLLLSNKKRANLLADYATPFAAGALLAAAFTDLLTEAGEQGSFEVGLRWALIGMVLFFLLERFLHWFHHHHEHEDDVDPTTSLIVIGDTVHNFIDGIAIAAGFLVDTTTGMIVTLAVATHEIPQEIGDFGLLLRKGMTRKQVIQVNILSALATVVAATVFFQIGQDIAIPLDIILGLVAGFFIYIAASDIIPSIHEVKNRRIGYIKAMLLVVGVLTVSATTYFLHDVIEQSNHGAESSLIEEDDH